MSRVCLVVVRRPLAAAQRISRLAAALVSFPARWNHAERLTNRWQLLYAATSRAATAVLRYNLAAASAGEAAGSLASAFASTSLLCKPADGSKPIGDAPSLQPRTHIDILVSKRRNGILWPEKLRNAPHADIIWALVLVKHSFVLIFWTQQRQHAAMNV
jgi:hypothetical protein